jgi:glucose-6-phosphate 1-dehydrogenase
MGVRLTDSNMIVCYNKTAEGLVPEAYQKLLLDALRGDHTLFVGGRETELSWQVLGPVLDSGQCGTYPQKSVPASGLGVDWIDFDRYESWCAAEK